MKKQEIMNTVYSILSKYTYRSQEDILLTDELRRDYEMDENGLENIQQDIREKYQVYIDFKEDHVETVEDLINQLCLELKPQDTPQRLVGYFRPVANYIVRRERDLQKA